MRQRTNFDRETLVLIGVWVALAGCGGLYFACAVIANIVSYLTQT